MKTIFVKSKDITRKWFILDAEGKTLGRVATKVASVLRGKHKAVFSPHQELGDYVIIVNADKIALTGRKETDKTYYRHSGYPGSLRGESFAKIIERKPTFPVEQAIKGMLPKGRMGRKLFTNVKVYAGPDHPHAAQKPEIIEI
jgi:large subunit ribosomal protein L13